MVSKKKTRGVLIKVKDLNKEQLDTSIDSALDALFGKEEEQKPVKKHPGKKKGHNLPK